MMARLDGYYFDILGPGCGDVTHDNVVNVIDIIYLISYKFQNGPAPDPMEEADVDLNGVVNILDIIMLINFKFNGGPAPACM